VRWSRSSTTARSGEAGDTGCRVPCHGPRRSAAERWERGEATSEGDPNALGWSSTWDIEAAIEFVRSQPDVDPDRIGGIGFSVGGEMLLPAAAGNDALRAVVSEGAGIRSYREVWQADSAEKWVGWPIWAATTAGAALLSDTMPPPNLKDLVADIAPRPVLLIYAERGCTPHG
jgi:dienelactone hydrolase